MLNKISTILELISLIGLIYGYSRKNRNIMLICAIILWFAGSLNDAVSGFIAGWNSVH